MFLPLVVFPKHLSFVYTREDWYAPHMHCLHVCVCVGALSRWRTHKHTYHRKIFSKVYLLLKIGAPFATKFRNVVGGWRRRRLTCFRPATHTYILTYTTLRPISLLCFSPPTTTRLYFTYWTHRLNQQKQIDFDYDKDMFVCVSLCVCAQQCGVGTQQNKDLIHARVRQLKKMKQFWFNAHEEQTTTEKVKKKNFSTCCNAFIRHKICELNLKKKTHTHSIFFIKETKSI